MYRAKSGGWERAAAGRASRWLLGIEALLFLGLSGIARDGSAEGLPHPYENLRVYQLHATLSQPSVQIAENLSLREVVRGVEYAIGSTVWLDRRLDGEQSISLPPGPRSISALLQEVCQQAHAELAWIENLLYLAPPGQASHIEAAYWRLFTQPATPRWRETAPLRQWSSSREVSELIGGLKGETPLPIAHLIDLPKDRWGAASLASASLAAHWTCLLAGFDRTLIPDDVEGWRLGPLPSDSEAAAVVWEYPASLRQVPTAKLQGWRQQWPGSEVNLLPQGGFRITATVAAHRELIALANALKYRPVPPGRAGGKKASQASRYSLNLQGTVGDKLPPLTQQLGYALKPWPLPDAVMQRRLAVELKDVTLPELLDALGRVAGLKLELQGETIRLEVLTP
jgi:hypothetical protein